MRLWLSRAIYIAIIKSVFDTQGATPDFKWQGWSKGGKNQNSKKSLGLQTKPKKTPWTKI